MTKEDFFRQNFSEYCRGDTFLSPHWDLFETGYELKQDILSQHILELQADKGNLTDRVTELEAQIERLEGDLELWESGACRATNLDKCGVVKELKAQIEKMKLQYDYAFNQLCESREIVCLMLSQYKNKKEIDYSTKERGEKLLKQGVYKYD